VIPGPGWLSDQPGYLPDCDGTTMGANGWPVPPPFKYAPQGHRPSPVPDYESCLLTPEDPDNCFCTTPPTYFGTFYFDVVALDRRSNLESTPLYFDSNNALVFSTSDFNLDPEAGIRPGIILSEPCGNDLIFEYFGIHSFEDLATIQDPAGVTAVFFDSVGAPVPTLVAQYKSNLDSIDLAIRTRQTRRIAPLVGIRWVQLDEEFNSIQDLSTNQGWFSSCDNDLFGFQFGFQGLLFEWGCIRFETTAKGGPYFNDIDVNTSVTPANQAVADTRNVSHWHTAFVGDLRVALVWRLGRRMNLRLGYDALMLSGIALGPNQNNNISYATNLRTVDLSDVIYQGGHIGFDLSW
jgi:hypothetical protein